METHDKLAKVWMIEDNELDVALSMRTFQQMGLDLDIKVFRDGGSVSAHIKKDEGERKNESVPDLIFLDLTLPILSGMDLLGRFKANMYYMDVPVVVLSGSTYVMDKENTLKKGAAMYLNKPLKPDAFQAMIEELPDLHLRKIDNRYLLIKEIRESRAC